MKKITVYIIFLSLFVSACSVKKLVIQFTGIKTPAETGYGNLRHKPSENIYDNLSENKMPKVLLDYYQSVGLGAFKRVEIRVYPTIKDDGYYLTPIIFSSKKAKDGYLDINQYLNEYTQITPIDYLINSDTVNNEKMINKLLSLRRKDIISYVLIEDKYLKIATK
jgi:hypothetical protein